MTAETAEPTLGTALAHAGSRERRRHHEQPRCEGPTSNSKAAYFGYHRHIVASSAAHERQCAAAAARGRCRGADPRSPFEFGSNPWMNVGPAGRPSPLVARCPPSGGAADDPPLATVETSDPTGSLT